MPYSATTQEKEKTVKSFGVPLDWLTEIYFKLSGT